MDDLFCELVGVDSNRAFNFFLSGLQEVTGRQPDKEMLYVANVLGHYTQTSCHDSNLMSPPANLLEVFDRFVIQEVSDPEVLEIGGSQIILFAGFFRDQMRRRHNVGWYDEVGKSFYFRASNLSRNLHRRMLFEGLSESLPKWTIGCRDLSRTLRDNRFLLKRN